MSRARVGLRVGICAVVVSASGLGVACGRTGIDACTWQACDDPDAGRDSGGNAGHTARAGSSAGATAGVAGVGGAGMGGASGGVGAVAGVPAGGAGAAGGGQAGSGGQVSEPPLVLLLLDGSTSMYDRQVWAPTYEALTGPDGPLERFQDRVRFGFASYRGRGASTEDDPTCAVITSVGFGLSNASPIREAYASLGSLPRFPAWETPTGHALHRVLPDLLAASPGAAKYIVLISDGAPDTCATPNPQCGQDRSVSAVQEAFRAGIETRAIGVGFGNDYPGCTSDTAHCGREHFQDLANAGRGLRVLAPPDAYRSLPCIAETEGQLLGEYSAQGDQAPFFWTQSPLEVAKALEAVLVEIVRR